MRYLKSFYIFLCMLLPFSIPPLYGQQLTLQTFSLASDYFVTTQMDSLQIDWRLDLGPTALALDQSSNYPFSAGFLQPSINRFAPNGFLSNYNPSIELKNTFHGAAIVLFSKEPDLILFGCKIFDLYGQIILSDQTKYRSSYQGRFIDIHALSSGIYIVQVLYLPEWMAFDNHTNYWVKSIKFIKP